MVADQPCGLLAFITDLLYMLLCFAILGAISFVMGEAIPRENIDHRTFPYRSYRWEQEGKFYLRFRIDRWKDKVPDMSRYVSKTVRKRMPLNRMGSEMTLQLVRETCVAELVHWILVVISPVFLLLMPTLGWGVAATVLGVLGNLPFIMIQRYNRPRMARVLERQILHEQRRKAS